MNEQLVKRICTIRTLMERIAEKYQYNMVHPTVVDVSQRLDRLIVSYMKKMQLTAIRRRLYVCSRFIFHMVKLARMK